ncbi:MAG: dTDP-4-dehydrorhamnose reductase [Lentisphaerae bacterium]|nr:dTDP-4-dehydrorhamnose reductase [Lentisphaerota bacterium]
MKIMLTGGRGMLGRTLTSVLKTSHEVLVTDYPEADITDYFSISSAIRRCTPDVVIHCAAKTAVDLCETEQVSAYTLNAYGSANVAKACFENDVRLIAISTDYVFDGNNPIPRKESDPATGGNTVYGKSKFLGEQLIMNLCPTALICRVAWLYGNGGPSFVHTILKLADGSRPQLKVVSDQIGNPTSCLAVAKHMRIILEHPELCGICHLTCEGETSWFEFAKEICRLNNINQEIIPCTTAEFPRPAPRPAYSCLDNEVLRLNDLPPMPHWQKALENFFIRGSIW